MLHKTDYGLVYNDDGSLCVTHQEDGAVAVEEETTNVIKTPYYLVASDWSTFGFSDSTTHTRITESNDNINGGSSIKVERIASSPTMTANCSSIGNPTRVVLSPGEKATLSGYVKGSSGLVGKPLALWFYGNRSTGGQFSTGAVSGTISSEWQRFSATVTNNTADQNWTITTIYFRADCGTTLQNGEHFFVHLPQLEKKPFATSFTEGTRPDGILAYPIALKDDYTIACYRKSHIDEDYKHVVKRSDGKVFVDGAEDSEYDVGWIAGRNLLLDSGELKNTGGLASGISRRINEEGHLEITAAPGNGNWASGLGIVINPEHGLQNGDIITVSVKVKSEDATGIPTLYLGNGMSYLRFNGEIGPEFSTIQYTRVWNGPHWAPHMGFSGISGTFVFKEIKLEKSSTATDWTPAPEDLGYGGDLLMLSNHTGHIKDLKILPYIATDKEIKQMYSGGTFDVTDKGIVIADSYSEVGITDGLIGWWPLSGHTDDYSGNNNHGTLGGSPSITAFGRQRGYSFLSSGDRVNIAPTGSGISTITLSAWHKWHTTSSTWRTIFGHTGNFHHLIFASNRVVSLWDGSQRTFGYSSPDNEWHLYTIIIESGVRAELYVDGIYRGQSPTTLNLTTYPVHVIGNWGSGSYPAGSLSDARIYNRALSPEEIKSLYDATKPNAIPMQLSNDGTVYLSGELKEA